jgi:chemotaxis receptor (MCP) glutamine deamidase CheD
MANRQSLIPVGQYYASTDPQEDLITVVGSCVAVTLHDNTNPIRRHGSYRSSREKDVKASR